MSVRKGAPPAVRVRLNQRVVQQAEFYDDTAKSRDMTFGRSEKSAFGKLSVVAFGQPHSNLPNASFFGIVSKFIAGLLAVSSQAFLKYFFRNNCKFFCFSLLTFFRFEI